MATRSGTPRRVTDSLKKRVERELAECTRRIGLTEFLNNFFYHLPGEYRRQRVEVIPNTRYDDPRASKKRQGQTYTEFHAVVDRVIAELGLDVAKISALQKSLKLDRLYEYVWPLYLRLRAEGYKHHPDLTA